MFWVIVLWDWGAKLSVDIISIKSTHEQNENATKNIKLFGRTRVYNSIEIHQNLVTMHFLIKEFLGFVIGVGKSSDSKDLK